MLKKFLKKLANRKITGFRNTYLHKPGSLTEKTVTLIPGINIGPEVTNSITKIFETAKVPIEFETIPNFDFSNKSHRTQLKKNKYLLVGNIGHKDSKTLEHLQFYKYLNLYSRVTHLHNLPNIPSRHKNIDIIIIRENLEGEFSGVEHEVAPGIFESLKIITKKNSLKIANYAFEHALISGRKKVTAVHKANIMKLVDGIFLEATREVSKNFPSIHYEEIIVDNCAMQMVSNPQQFDVMVMPNLYGSIVSAIGAGLVGGAGVVAGASVGEQFLLFDQGCRNSGFDITGRNLVNPTAIVMAGCNLLKSNGLNRFADLIYSSVLNVYEEGKFLTPDVGGGSGSLEFTERVCEEIRRIDAEGTV